MKRDALAALFYLTAAAVIIAGAISLAVAAESRTDVYTRAATPGDRY